MRKGANSNDIILLMSEFDNQSSSMGRFLGGSGDHLTTTQTNDHGCFQR